MKLLLAVVFLAGVEVMLVSSQTGTTDVMTGVTTVFGSTEPLTTGAVTSEAVTSNQPTTAGQTVWQLEDSSGNVCILAKMDAAISVSYTKTDNSTRITTLKLPENAEVNQTDSNCGNGSLPATLVLDWESNSFRQVFSLNGNDYSLTSVAAAFYHDEINFPDSKNADKTVTYMGTPPAMFFGTTSDKSYKCNSMESFDLGSNGNISYTNVKVQPFGINGTGFSEEYECAADRSTTTTPKPSPTPKPPAGNWTVRDDDGNICMNMTLRAKFTIKYWTTENKAGSLEVHLPDDADATTYSKCNDTVANFVLTFNNWQMSMLFERSKDSDLFDVDDDQGDYSAKNYTFIYFMDEQFHKPVNPGAKVTVYNTKTGIEASVGKYYKCDSTSKVKAGNTTTAFSSMKLQPFAQATNGTQGDDYNECVADSAISNIVPIAVGCALAGLVIIVLIAYLIGRSRSSRQGYQSV